MKTFKIQFFFGLLIFLTSPLSAYAKDVSAHPLVIEWLQSIDFPFDRYNIPEQAISLPEPRTPNIKSLIITNSKYAHYSELKSVKADRKEALKAFKEHKIDTTYVSEFSDVTSFFKELRAGPALLRRKKGFKEKIDEGDIVVIYYSGHGFMHGTETYLVPTQMTKDDIYEDRLSHDAVPLNMILEEVYEEYPSYVFVIFDACRTISPSLIDRDKNSVPLKGDFAGYKERVSWNKKFPNTYLAFAAESSYPAEASASYDTPSPYTSIFYDKFDPEIVVNMLVTHVNGTLASMFNRRAEGINKSGTYTSLRLSDDEKSKEERASLWLTTLLSALDYISRGDVKEANDAIDLYLNLYSTHEYAPQAQFIRDANLFQYTVNFTGMANQSIVETVSFSDAVDSLKRIHGPIGNRVINNVLIDVQTSSSLKDINYANIFCVAEYRLESFIRENTENNFSNNQNDVDIIFEEIQQALNGKGKPENYLGVELPFNFGRKENVLVLLNINLSPDSNVQKELAYLNRLKVISEFFREVGFLTAGNIHTFKPWETSLESHKDDSIDITLCALRPHDQSGIRYGAIQTSKNTIEDLKIAQEPANLPQRFSRKRYSFDNAPSTYGYEVEF